METLLKNITRQPHGTTVSSVISGTKEGELVSLVFKPVLQHNEQKEPLHISGDSMRGGQEYTVKVKSWMTKKTSSDEFDFMRRWNNDVPMPYIVMRGRVLKETRGMVYMELTSCPDNVFSSAPGKQNIEDVRWRGWIAKSGVEYAVEE